MLKNKTLSFGMSYVLNFIFINYWGKFKMLNVLILHIEIKKTNLIHYNL